MKRIENGCPASMRSLGLNSSNSLVMPQRQCHPVRFPTRRWLALDQVNRLYATKIWGHRGGLFFDILRRAKLESYKNTAVRPLLRRVITFDFMRRQG
jgi:hypothetical protein